MNRKLPPDAFDFYQALGQSRSYQAVADRYRVTKRAVTLLAAREQWQERVLELERKARVRSDEKAVESLEEMNTRHLKVLRFIQSRSIETMKSTPLDSAMDAVRAYALSVDKERLIRGEPTGRAEIDLAQLVKRESERWMVLVEAKPGEAKTEQAAEANSNGNGTS